MTFIVSMLIGVAVTLYLRRNVTKAAYVEGQRAGLKQARALLKEKSNSALYLAPSGKLNEGLMRARASHDAYLELGTMINQVGR